MALVPGWLALRGPRALYVGPLQGQRPHDLHALKIVVGLRRPFVLRVGSRGGFCETWSAVIRPGTAHALCSGSDAIAVLLVQPETHGCLAAVRALPASGVDVLPTVAERRVRSLVGEALDIRRDGGRQDRSAEVDALVDAVAGVVLPTLRGGAPAAVLDPRIRDVVRRLWGGADPGLPELAGGCGVSPSRLTHLFRQETGTSLRHYRSWVRLRSALDVLWSRQSLTDLAHSTGFADSAHFSRAVRQMLGSTPSDLRSSMVAVGAR
jgi:AraC-like DNA-binding protein